MKTSNFLAFLITCIILISCGQKSAQNTAQNSETQNKAELKIVSFNGTELPLKMEHKGTIQSVIRYTDAMGDNCVFTTGKYFTSKNKAYGDYGLNNDELYVYHYLINNDGTAKQIWRIFDYAYECMDGVSVSVADNAFNVTDLDKDGMAEVWVLYKTTGCATDCCFPNPMKVIMYEGTQKYAMRGTDKFEQITEYEGGRKVTTSEGGEYKFDSAFQNGNSEFRDYALKLWNDNIIGITMRL